MINFIKLTESLLTGHGIEYHAPLALADCVITRPYLLERAGFIPGASPRGTAVFFLIPYYTRHCDAHDNSAPNISAYAVARDYHIFADSITGSVCAALRQEFPAHIFAGFCDRSPFDETVCAARAGLGVIGENRLLINERYSSFVFIGEIITDIAAACPPPRTPGKCRGCGGCRTACPSGALGKPGADSGDVKRCISAITQKKGGLSDEEIRLIAAAQSCFGCDICQRVCPHTAQAGDGIYTPSDYFYRDPIHRVTAEVIAGMTDSEFGERAYSWRGRETILRNIDIIDHNRNNKHE